MKEEKIFEGITDIREDIIERAEAYVFPGESENTAYVSAMETYAYKRRAMWITLTAVAACLLLVFGTPLVFFATRMCGSKEAVGTDRTDQGRHEAASPGNVQKGQENLATSAPEMSISTDNVWIYFVEAGEICREQHFVKLQPADVFALWKEKNGIGAEVQLLDCEVRSNATTEQVGEIVMHELGDSFALYLTVSKNLEDYYGQTDEVLLLTSLEQTMTGYSGLTYQEYHLILE